MILYREYRGYEIHFEESERGDRGHIVWKVLGYGSEHSNGVELSRQNAYMAACNSIDDIESNPYRFPINLLGYPLQSDGDVITQYGEVLGRWRMSANEELEIVEFIPDGSTEVLIKNHFIGILCEKILVWSDSVQSS